MKDTKFKRIQCIDRALDIIEIASLGECRTVAEIASQVELNIATTYNIVKTLMSRGYMEEKDGTYRIGETLRMMAQTDDRKGNLFYTVRPMLLEIAHRLENYHVSVAARSEDRLETVTLMADSQGKYQNQYLNRTWDDPMYLAAGRVILAFGNEAEWMRFIEYHLDSGIQNQLEDGIGHYELYKQLETIRRKGEFSMMVKDGDNTRFGAAAVPLFSGDGTLLGAIGASCYEAEATPARLDILLRTIHSVIDTMWSAK